MKPREQHNVLEGIRGGGNDSYLSHLSSGHRSDEGREISAGKIVSIPLDKITPRPINRYRQVNIERLAKSIKTSGLMQKIVVTRGINFSKTSAVSKAFEAKGVDVATLDYVLTIGHRRYAAYRLLHEEEKNDPDRNPLEPYKYDKIEAVVLTADEALREEEFYNESNLETRQLSIIEVIMNCRDIVRDVDTIEAKKKAVEEMYGDASAAKFNEVKYASYYLKNALGIEGLSDSSIKSALQTIKHCTPEVVDAICDASFTEFEARKLRGLPANVQNELLKAYQTDRTRYELLLEKNRKKEKAGVDERLNYRDAIKSANKLVPVLEKKRKELLSIRKDLGEKDREILDKLVEDLENLKKEISVVEEKLNSR